MKRHLIVLYIVVVVLLMAGRLAWQNCSWDILSRVSAVAVLASTLIIGWKIIFIKEGQAEEITLRGEMLSAIRTALLVLCAGMIVASVGDLAGKWIFGCR